MAILLQERGLVKESKLHFECAGFKCVAGATSCCCRHVLYSQPDFVAVESLLEGHCHVRGFQVLLLPKFHCELNFIEQCWGYAKRKYWEFPPSSKEADLKKNLLCSLEMVSLESMRRRVHKMPRIKCIVLIFIRFSYWSQRFMNLYYEGLSRKDAAWACTVPFNSIQQVTGHRPSRFDEMSHLSQVTGPPDEIIQRLTIFLCINNSSIIAKLLTNCRIFLQVTGHNQTCRILNFVRLVTGHTPCRIELNGTVRNIKAIEWFPKHFLLHLINLMLHLFKHYELSYLRHKCIWCALLIGVTRDESHQSNITWRRWVWMRSILPVLVVYHRRAV